MLLNKEAHRTIFAFTPIELLYENSIGGDLIVTIKCIASKGLTTWNGIILFFVSTYTTYLRHNTILFLRIQLIFDIIRFLFLRIQLIFDIIRFCFYVYNLSYNS